MREHYDGDTPVVTLFCKICGNEFENYGITMEKLQELAIKHPEALNCAECDPN